MAEEGNMCSIDFKEDGSIKIRGKNKEYCKKILDDINIEEN